MYTNLVLGTNWASEEWPEHIVVSHVSEGAQDGVCYVPARETCRYLPNIVEPEGDGADEDCEEFSCSVCDFTMAREGWFDSGGAPYFSYCPNCGAKVADDGD